VIVAGSAQVQPSALAALTRRCHLFTVHTSAPLTIAQSLAPVSVKATHPLVCCASTPTAPSPTENPCQPPIKAILSVLSARH